MRRIETEQPRLDLLDRESTHRAGKARREHRAHAVIRTFRIHNAVGKSQGGLKGIRQPLLDPRLHHNAVHHRLDLVLQLLVERRDLIDLVELAVHFRARKTFALQFGEFFFILALAVADDGGEQQQFRALLHRHHAVHHLRDVLRLDRQAGRGRIRHPGARPEQAHVVMDFRHRPHGRARIMRGGFLLDGNRRRQALDAVHIRLAHQLQKLPRIGGQALHIAPLPLGIDRIEGERGFARARQPGNHRQFFARNGDINVLEVMLTRAADRDEPSAC